MFVHVSGIDFRGLVAMTKDVVELLWLHDFSFVLS